MLGDYKVITKLIREHLEAYNVKAILLFGSRAREVSSKNSDYDLIIVGDFPENPKERLKIITDLITNILLDYKIRLSPILLTQEELEEEVNSLSPLIQTITLGHKILYDPYHILSEALEKLYERKDLTYIERGRRWKLKNII